MTNTSNARAIFLTAVGIFIAAIMLFPVYWTIVAALKTNNEIYAIPPALFPPTPYLGAFARAINAEWHPFLSSIIIAAGTVVLSMAVATPAAYALAHFKLHFAAGFVIALLLAQMVPSVIIANNIYVIFDRLGLLNTYVGLVIADSSYGIPFAVLVLRAFMQAIPAELPEAARVDGATDFATFIRIIVPISRSAIITAGLFTFLFAWGDFLFALTIMSRTGKQPITLGLYRFIGQYSRDWNATMATAVIASVPAAILLIVAQRYVAAGLTAGSIKA